MKKIVFFTIAILCSNILLSQEKKPAFKVGEMLKYRMSYSGFLKAGNAILEVKEGNFRGKNVFHATGKGWTTGMVDWFFNVKDLYQTFMDKETGKPYLFKRKIQEGGYKKNKSIMFSDKQAYVQDFINQKDTIIPVANVQDMLSSFYYLRNYDVKKLKPGEEMKLNMFFDEKKFLFRLKLLNREILKTRFGKVKTLKFRPIVKAGRVFKEKESVTIWVTDDDNKIPIKLKASLSVGSLQAELKSYKGLANSFEIIRD